MVWFLVAGVYAIARWLIEFADVQYYDPESLLDYSAVILQTAAGLATGVALIVLWRNPPVKRGAFLIGLGAARSALRIPEWKDDFSLYRSAVEVSPRSGLPPAASITSRVASPPSLLRP